MSVRKLLGSCKAQLQDFDWFHHGLLCEIREGELVRKAWNQTDHLRPYDFAFYVVRHPLERLLSCYRYFIQGGLNQFGRGHFPDDFAVRDFLLDRAPTFQDCCLQIEAVAERIVHVRPISSWLAAFPQPLASEVMVCRYESFDADLIDVFARLGVSLDRSDVPWQNQSQPLEFSTALDARACERVCSYYRDDFERFAYPLPDGWSPGATSDATAGEASVKTAGG